MAHNKYRLAQFILVAVALIACLMWVTMQAQGAVTNTPRSSLGVVYSQPPDPNGGYYNASENGMDYDEFVWDDFTLASTQAITGITWRGNYDPLRSYTHQPLVYFTVAIYASSAGQPDIINLPLVEYQVDGNAGETAAGTFGGVVMYDYAYTLPAAFVAAAGTKYWIYLEAFQAGVPDWCIAKGSGGDGQHFHGAINYAGGTRYDYQPGDTAFTLLGPGGATMTPTTTNPPTPTPSARIYLPLVGK